MTIDNPQTPAAWREKLENLWGHPEQEALSPYERVETALAHRTPDRTPFDFWAVPEAIEKLKAYLGAADEQEVLRLLGVDCRLVRPDYIGPQPQTFPDGTFYTPWGSHRRLVSNDFSTYEEYASFPLAEAETVADVLGWDWAQTEDWDVSGVRQQCETLNAGRRHHLRYEVGGIFEWAWALRGFERLAGWIFDHRVLVLAGGELYQANMDTRKPGTDDLAIREGICVSQNAIDSFQNPA